MKPFLGSGFLLLLGCAQLPATLPALAAGPVRVASVTARAALPAPDAYFRTQTQDARWHPEPVSEDNANCGPTSLGMALLAYGVAPAGDQDVAHAQELIMDVRQALTGDRDLSRWTYPAQFPAAAARYGLGARPVHGVDEVVSAAAAGHLVVVNVNPTPAYSEQLAHPCDGGHFALVTGISGDRIQLNDPLAPAPMTISRAQLETALTTDLGPGLAPYDGGIELWREEVTASR